jgi:hypothetical protein
METSREGSNSSLMSPMSSSTMSQREHADGDAFLVDRDAHVLAGLLSWSAPRGAAPRRPRHLDDVAAEVGGPAGEQVHEDRLHVDEADDLALGAVHERVAGEPLLGDDRRVLRPGAGRVEARRGLERHHDVLEPELAEVEGVLEEQQVVEGEAAALLRGAEDRAELLLGVRDLDLAGGLDPDEAQDRPRGAVHERERDGEDPVEDPQRARDEQRRPFGVLDGDGLERELADDDVDAADQQERGGGRGPVRGGGRHEAAGREHALEDAGERGLADPAERQARQRDAELRRRQVVVEPADDVQCLLRLRRELAPRLDELLEPRRAHLHERELGQHEEAVQHHEGERGEDPGGVVEHRVSGGEGEGTRSRAAVVFAEN